TLSSFPFCKPTLSTVPILWLPMTQTERSRVLRWRLGWLPGGKPKPCPYHPATHFNLTHAIGCLHMHNRLYLPVTVKDPLSFLLNHLPVNKPRLPQSIFIWFIHWPIICTILHELDYLIHDKFPSLPFQPGRKLLDCLSC
ncbi:MAG: hypothetical protein EXX96DRAFT_478968, partial [Benjaminiella poitrasii]